MVGTKVFWPERDKPLTVQVVPSVKLVPLTEMGKWVIVLLVEEKVATRLVADSAMRDTPWFVAGTKVLSNWEAFRVMVVPEATDPVTPTSVEELLVLALATAKVVEVSGATSITLVELALTVTGVPRVITVPDTLPATTAELLEVLLAYAATKWVLSRLVMRIMTVLKAPTATAVPQAVMLVPDVVATMVLVVGPEVLP